MPLPWIDFIRPLKDYMDAPEEGNFYIQINTTRPPMNDIRVRKAFSLSLDRDALARFRRVAKPLSAFIPQGIYPGYPNERRFVRSEARQNNCCAEAGYRDAAGNFDPSKFPIDKVEYTYNNTDPYRQVAELLQSQWKQNLRTYRAAEKHGDADLFHFAKQAGVSRDSLVPAGSATTWIRHVPEPVSDANGQQRNRMVGKKLRRQARRRQPHARSLLSDSGNWAKPSSNCWTPTRNSHLGNVHRLGEEALR